MEPEPMPLDDWSAPPTPPLRESLSPAPTLFDNTFANIPRIDLHPTSSDASSSSTLATSSVATLNETSSDETSSSLRTTPEFDDDGGKCSSKAALDLTDQVSKQIEAEAAQVQQQNAAGTTDSSTTRRRSMRIKTMVVPSKETPTATRSTATTAPLTATIASEPTTPATATSPAAGDPPHTPSSRSKPAPDTASPADGDAPSTAKRSLRSSVRKPQRESQSGPKTENQSKSTPAAQLATESETSRRTSKRISAIYAHASGTPNAKSGKRAHDVMMADSKKSGSYSKKTKIEHGSDSGVSVSSSSSSRSSEAPSTSSEESVGPPVKRRKVWLEHGMYLGQEDGDLKLRPGSKGKKGKKTSRAETIPLPIFRGKDIMEITRDFKLPHAVFAPSATRCPNPPDWRKLNHNQLIGDAQQIWKREKPDNAKCICVLHCTDRCHNAACWIECTSKNCNAGRQCGNRSFADLTDRVKKETKFATGVEVALTPNRGYGLRALRSFEPRQIIVEYTGEIITQEESERRLDEVYKDNTNYYLMLFDQNMILDATRGSVARFVNHSCAPNCTMEKWIVEGRPRMALYAGLDGVEAGDELTYDYNFTWFKGVEQKKCYCGSHNCRGVLGKRSDRLPATPPKDEDKPTAKGKGKAKAKVQPKRRAARKEEVQKSVVITPVKRERKPPFPRKPISPKRTAPKESTPPPPVSVQESENTSPEPEPLVQTSDDDSGLSDVEIVTPPPIKAASPKPPVKTTRTRTRVGMKTYKINKTIAKSSTPKPVTSKAAVDAAKTIAFEEALVQLESEAERSPDTDAPLSGMVIDRLIMAGVGLPADIFVGA